MFDCSDSVLFPSLLRHSTSRAGVALLLCGGLLVGCEPKGRITLEQLREMETRASQVEPVALNTSQLSLVEMQPYQIASGDVITVTITGADDSFIPAVTKCRVHEDGTITLPLVGKVGVGGRDFEGAEKMIYDTYVPGFVKAMSVYVELTGPEQTTVMVSGAATAPGMVALPRNERNVLYAVARASGFGNQSTGRVMIKPVDPQRPEQTYDLTSINDLRRALIAPPLQSGDLVMVEAAPTSAVYMSGLIVTPGPLNVPAGGQLSLVRAVAASGGLRDFLEPKDATLWRRLPSGEQVRVKIELAKIMAGEAEDVSLFPGDILDVPHTADTRFREWVAANIRIGPFGVGAFYDPVSVATFRDDDDDNRNGFGQILRTSIGSTIPAVIAGRAASGG